MFTLNNKRPLILAVVAVVAFTLFLSPTFTVNDVMAKEKKNKGNDSDQDIDQGQSSKQNAQCVSGDDVLASCNNLSAQDQDNDGNNAAGQQNGKGKGNDNDQGVDQDQDSKQNTQCVAGGSIALSCNNLSAQNQDNEGNNAAAQHGGDGHKKHNGNDSDQGVDQDQDNDQKAQCVSGEDAIVSCNSLSFQNQFNEGSNALGQN